MNKNASANVSPWEDADQGEAAMRLLRSCVAASPTLGRFWYELESEVWDLLGACSHARESLAAGRYPCKETCVDCETARRAGFAVEDER